MCKFGRGHFFDFRAYGVEEAKNVNKEEAVLGRTIVDLERERVVSVVNWYNDDSDIAGRGGGGYLT